MIHLLLILFMMTLVSCGGGEDPHKLAVLHDRAEKDRWFRTAESPLTDEGREHFQGLKYFKYHPELRFVLNLERLSAPEPASVAASKGENRTYYKLGRFHFVVDGRSLQLSLYSDSLETWYFLPFTDRSNGHTTYDGGRYLDPEHLDNGSFVVDFNRAYNPWCAFSDRYSCAIPPEENHLDVAILAGEKYQGH